MGSVLPTLPSGIVLPGQPMAMLPSYFVVPQGLVGYWGLSYDCLDFTSNVALDISANGNVGTLVSETASQLATGIIGGALTFNGSNQYINVASSTSLNVGDSFSLMVWFKRGDTARKQEFINSNANGFAFGFLANDTIEIGKEDVASIAQTTTTITDTTIFHHAVATKNGSAVHLYIDSVDVTGTVTNQTISNPTAVVIGRYPGNLIYFNGRMSEVRIYNRAISPDEVLRIYQAGIMGRRDNAMPSNLEMPALIDVAVSTAPVFQPKTRYIGWYDQAA